ncbi:MAG: hypothetical protein FJW23_14140 [Acidimicrobiia bacterium]|nr:hypothetical protein [Acidimicrobiia bacterium]
MRRHSSGLRPLLCVVLTMGLALVGSVVSAQQGGGGRTPPPGLPAVVLPDGSTRGARSDSGPGQIWCVHSFSTDSAGNLCAAEVFSGRAEKFRPKSGADLSRLVGPLLVNQLR